MLAISSPIDVNSQQVLHYLGYGNDHEPPARTVSLVDEYIANAQHLLEPSYWYVIRDIEWVHGSIALVEDSIIFKSEVIARLLEQCQSVAVFALTIGNHLEEMVCHLAEDGLIVQASVLDAVGSVAAEKMADFVQDEVGKMARSRGLTISRRFSPGYCDWDIGQQRMLFWALKDKILGIRLTARCLMVPQKSISGIIGIGGSSVENYNPCVTCDKQDCVGRQ